MSCLQTFLEVLTPAAANFLSSSRSMPMSSKVSSYNNRNVFISDDSVKSQAGRSSHLQDR